MRATAKLVDVEKVYDIKRKKLQSLCNKYGVRNLVPILYFLFFRAKGALSSQVEHFQEVVSMCDTLLALRRYKKLSSVVIGSLEIKFSSSEIISKYIEKALNEALLYDVCHECYSDSDPDNLGYVERFIEDPENELYQIYIEHSSNIEAHSDRLLELSEMDEDQLLEENKDLYDELQRETKYSDTLTEGEIVLIKSTYERFLDLETKAEGRFRKAEGSRTKNAKLGRLARQIMEKLPEDMEHKHLFVAEFLMDSGALDYKGESWMDSFQVKPDNEKERFVRIWIESSL